MYRDICANEISHGESLFRRGRITEALHIFKSVLDKDPDNIVALNDKGVALNALGRPKEATDIFLKIIDLDSHNPDAVFNLIENYIETAEWGKAGKGSFLISCPYEVNK